MDGCTFSVLLGLVCFSELYLVQGLITATLALRDTKPEFEVYDDCFTETQQSSSSIERGMTLKAFAESSTHAAF
jgi:hypothetical protein